MISECVGKVLAESKQQPNKQHQKVNNRKVMNESQLNSYVMNIINEEMEKEGFRGQLTGALKGGYQALKGFREKSKLDQENAKSENPKKKTNTNNRTSAWHKVKKTMANQAADSDRNEEFEKLIKRLETLQLNNYFDSREDIYNDVNNLIGKLKQFMKYQEGQTRGQYKRNFGVEHPDKQKQIQPQQSSGMNTNYRNERGNLFMGRY